MKLKCRYNRKDIQKSLKIYQQRLNEGNIQEVYYLIRYIRKLKTVFPKSYQTINGSLAYLDFSYFPFTNQYLKDEKLG